MESDDETVKKHYKTLALLLHPDKNRFNGAEEPASSSSSKPVDMTFSTVSMTFSTVCNKCTTRCCHFSTQNHLNKTFPCPNCGQNSAMTNISSTEVINGRTFIRVSISPQQEEPSRANSQATSSVMMMQTLLRVFSRNQCRQQEMQTLLMKLRGFSRTQ
ncbi:Chaperone J-domain superfamily [Arabidopsis suecica]|uniref:Chaperone J-domain superfamily n=1 Tax=Arabidopsis suecica TaxID=45249 RepID=A0A8T2DPI5_ARASU|nr:Chaperone J-domain superfamily [Arabidopsis suecica]